MLFSGDAIKSREQFETVYGKDISLKLFIRQLVGLDRNASKQALNKYLTGTNFTANQIRFQRFPLHEFSLVATLYTAV